MGIIKRPIHSVGAANAGEERLFAFLAEQLPDDYYIVPNVNLAVSKNRVLRYMEYDCLVVAPHALFHIENKDWAGSVVGDDTTWFRNGQELTCPLMTAGLKTRILASKIKNEHPDWDFNVVITLVTLSHPQQTKFGIDPKSECYNQTFTLGDDLIDFLSTPKRIGRKPRCIADCQQNLVEYLTSASSAQQKKKRTKVLEYDICEVLQETEHFTEYLCTHSLINTAYYKIREYPLDFAEKSAEELKKMELQIKNAEMAQTRIGQSPYIVSAQYRMNDDHTYYYEIYHYEDESTLRGKLRQRTFKQTDKLSIILDIARALQVAHKAQVVHRYISPENIYVYDGGKAALGHFGLAWFTEHTDLGFTMVKGNSLQNSPYIAPEVFEGTVDARTDIYSLGIVFYELMVGRVPFDSAITFITVYGGVLPKELLPTSIVNDLPQWTDEVARHTICGEVNNRWVNADEMIEYLSSVLSPKLITVSTNSTGESEKVYYLKDMKPGVKVSPSMTLHEMLGKGGFSRVFKVWHEIQRQNFAIKIFERDASVENAINEFKALQTLQHPNIVEFKFNDRTEQGLFYTLMELLDGENLQTYTQGELHLPMDEIYKMACEILSALEYMQSQNQPFYHRDIKPSNIMWHKRKVYKLIDFNISSSIDDKTFAGTLPYIPPDIIVSNSKIAWDKSADTFALGITLYQLLAHAYPWTGSNQVPNINVHPIDIREYNKQLSDAMASFVMKAIGIPRDKRFETAMEMLTALETIGEDGMLRDTTTVNYLKTNDSSKDPVDYINSLYSQSHHGNVGTRASIKERSFDTLTYTNTKLDNELLNDIENLKYRLVIITGNAGDGKTAIIKRIEERGENRTPYQTNNGSRFLIKNVPFESNYDGSQDEAEMANDEVLGRFFEPFFNLDDYTSSSEGRVIAINEGRLVEFLSSRPELRSLKDNIEDYFYKEGNTLLLPGLMIINLNLRSVTAHNDDAPSLLVQQVKKLTRPELWSKCGGCPIAEKCYIKYNVDTLQDSSAGDEVLNRLEWIVRTIVYKRELHITMRDLRSMISWMLTRDYSCEEVKKLLEYVNSKDIPEYYWQYYYFNLTSPEPNQKIDPQLPSLSSTDRLIKLLRETDIANVPLPEYDRDLYYTVKDEDDYLLFSDRQQNLLKVFNEANTLVPPYEMKEEDHLRQVRLRHKSFIRHQYFEGNIDFLRRLPYRYVGEFNAQLRENKEKDNEATMKYIAQAISSSEGCDNEVLTEGYLLLQNSNVGDPISKSYRRFPLEEFELFVNKPDHLTKYVEYESDSLIFRHKTDKFIQLTVSLDLYEMLQYIRHGFSPSANDLRGRFIELQIFKNLLEAKTYNEILVTKNNKKFYRIYIDKDKNENIKPIVIEPQEI